MPIPLRNHSLAEQPVLHQSRSTLPSMKVSLKRKTLLSPICKEAILPFLSTRLVLVLVGLLATYYLLPLLVSNPRLPTYAVNGAFPQSLWLMWRRFDSGFYTDIAQHGYMHATAAMLHTRTDWVFYPLYPLLIAGLGKLLGGGLDQLDLAGLLISNLAGIGTMIYLYRLVEKEFSQKVAARAVLYVAFFPLAFFLSAIYTESLLLCLSIACIYYARKRSWWLAGLCGGLAAFTRLQGVALVVPLAWEYVRVLSLRSAVLPAKLPQKSLARALVFFRCHISGLLLEARQLKNWLNGLALCLVPCGLLAFMIYGKMDIGDFFATFHASKWGWGRHFSSPLSLLIYSLRHPILGQPLNWNFWTLNIVATFAFLAVIVWSSRRLPVIYTLYTAVTVLLPLSSHSLNSIARYYLLVFPAFILLALLTNKEEKPFLHHFILGSFSALQAVLMIFFVLGVFAIA